MKIPDTAAACLQADILVDLEKRLAPVSERRASVPFEVEIEIVGEGTFTLRSADRTTTAKKGFAKKALLSVKVGKGAWGLLRDELQAASDGFPTAPALQKVATTFRETATTAQLDAAIKAVEKIAEGVAIVFDVKGEGVIVVARGSVDEAERELKITLQGSQVRALLTGAPFTSVVPTLAGDRSVGATVGTALGPLLHQLKLR